MAKLCDRTGVAALLLVSACYVGASTPGAGADSEGGPGGDSEDSEGETEGGEPASCGEPGSIHAGPAPLRRMTRFEYNNVVRDLFDDDTLPANALPSEVLGNGFGNDADSQSVSSLLAEQYAVVAEDVAERATATPQKLAKLAACAGEADAGGDEDACAREVIERLTTRAFRRPVATAEVDELLELRAAIREDNEFAVSIAAVIEGVLQSPDFLYRVEYGERDDEGRLRPTGHEMATRLSFFLWGSIPDDELLAAADSGELLDADGVRAQAERMLADPRSHRVVRHFFDNLLPISALHALERDEERYPKYTAQIGALMHEETQTFLERAIFEDSASWPEALTADYTYMNAELAEYYGVSGVQGEEFQRVELNTKQRLGILTHAGVVSGTIHSNETNPVVRGSFLVQKLMCTSIPLPSGDILDQVKPPDPGSGATARERYNQHSEDPVCASCHALMDPAGLAFENYDAIGLWRAKENGVTIDATGKVPGIEGELDGPIAVVRALAESADTQACFASHWTNFAYGRVVSDDEECLHDSIEAAFEGSGHDIAQLLVDLTQTDAFLYLPEEDDR